MTELLSDSFFFRVNSYLSFTFSSAPNPTQHYIFLEESNISIVVFFLPIYLNIDSQFVFLCLSWSHRVAVVLAIIYGKAADACDKKYC